MCPISPEIGLLFCISQYDEFQAKDLLRSNPQGAEKDSKLTSTPAAPRPVAAAAPSAELLNRRERRKGKTTALAAGLPVPPAAAAAKSAVPSQRSTAEIHQQMAEMKRYATKCRLDSLQSSEGFILFCFFQIQS